MLLLNLKLLIDIRSIRLTCALFAHLNNHSVELVRLVEIFAICSPISRTFLNLSPNELLAMQKKLARRACFIANAVNNRNEYFLPALLDPEDSLGQMMEMYTNQGPDEAAMAVQIEYPVWYSTAGALDLIYACLGKSRDKDHVCACLFNGHDVAGMMELYLNDVV
ncbi:hypothetical protein K470DRAFT_259437 [Piedraia hortae CBS 480.64]|uniref:Uncharacterized protein n=1 Tax=Piedraia hortae CBS 480.64 TaxID=1314780 RepID=A0A6A7BV37_9PEZI|nr:hypothetical protein K470DRAFT_259437 [Piedraia hortae CBS 480.64]